MKDIKPLTSLLDDPEAQKEFVSDIISRIEHHINTMGALKGLVIRKSYAAVQSVRPGYVEHIITVLTRDYLHEYTPLHEEYRAAQHLPAETVTPLAVYFKDRGEELKPHFWRIADAYAARYKDRFLGRLYTKFRPVAESHLPEIYKEITQIIEKYTLFDA